jgi:hypothetical protein
MNFSFLCGAANSGRHAGNMKLNTQHEDQILTLDYLIRVFFFFGVIFDVMIPYYSTSFPL